MPRLSLALAITAAVLVACSGPTTLADSAPSDRLEVISGLRGVDVCALYGAAESVNDLPLTIEGFSSALNCDATMEDPAGPADATIALNIGPDQSAAAQPSWIRHEVIDGVDVTVASSAEQPDAPPKEDMVSWSCEWAAK